MIRSDHQPANPGEPTIAAAPDGPEAIGAIPSAPASQTHTRALRTPGVARLILGAVSSILVAAVVILGIGLAAPPIAHVVSQLGVFAIPLLGVGLVVQWGTGIRVGGFAFRVVSGRTRLRRRGRSAFAPVDEKGQAL